MNKIAKFILPLLMLAALPAMAADDAPKPIGNHEVNQFLDATSGWYRTLATLEAVSQSPREQALKDSIRSNATKAMRLALDFARAESAIIAAENAQKQANAVKPEDAAAAPPSDKQTLAQASQAAQQRVADTKLRLQKADGAVARAEGYQRSRLRAQRDKIAAELQLAQAQNDLLTTVTNLTSGTKVEADNELMNRIADLDKSLPALVDKSASNGSTTVKVETTAAKQDDTQQEYTGIFTLGGNTLDILQKKRQLGELTGQTERMKGETQALIGQLRDQLKQATLRGNAIAQQASSTDMGQLDAQKRELDGIVATYKRLSAAISPLAEQSLWIDAALRNFGDWNKQLDQQFVDTLGDLLVRLAILAVAILIPLVISEFVRRATHRYVHDERRLNQLRTIRRIFVWAAIVIIVILNFVSEFGSLATYAGLLTAGLAVALQNVILSMVAHFFFFGRFGVRVGDRVTVTGVTGDVVEIGLVRFYMMEMKGERDPHPTGRIVAFPNSVLFQQSAFFKQIPGTHYTWRTVNVVLKADTDLELARERMLAAINKVYGDYSESMKRQQSILESSTRLRIKLPKPEARMKFVDSGLAFEARYPAETGRTGEIDDKVTKAIMEALAADDKLRLAAASAPKITAEA